MQDHDPYIYGIYMLEPIYIKVKSNNFLEGEYYLNTQGILSLCIIV